MSWRLGVIGSPIAHSLSPQLHEAGMALAGVAGTSTRFEVASGDLARVAGLLRDYDALSVTMPLKTQVVELCDVLDETAGRVGAVNSLLVRDGRVEGANTDGLGFVDALVGELGFHAKGRAVVLLGAGGAARAIVDALAASGARRVDVVGRSAASVQALAAAYSVVHEGVSGDEPADLVVNTTPVSGRVIAAPVATKPAAVAVDITYEPRVSPWLAQYEESGCRVVNGLAMLAYQAARQLSWWFDVPIDGAALLEVIR
ncbi:MAG: shikimate dehydrogenase family protein [Acidimicrobiales bacterium]